MPSRIEDYALIGDLGTAALVGRDGSIDWLCWPRFDSDACFAALLGGPEHGRWKIAPEGDIKRITRRYQPDTLILETTFATAEGEATIVDFMPPREDNSQLVRLIRGDKGCVTLCGELVIRFGYGAVVPWVMRLDDHTIRGVAGPDMVILRSDVRMRGENMRTVGEFTVAAGETKSFTLTYAASHLHPPAPEDPQQALKRTKDYWAKWTGRCKTTGPWAGAVKRSLITLKALTYAPTGGIVAAPTTSLPEQLGGERNWDYRFCWLRDATLTLLALMNAGYYDEAQAWRDWLLRAVAGSPDQMQIMYGIAGERRLMEWEVPWLPGYEKSAPVRIGNAAHSQLQLDVFGELMDALHQARQGEIAPMESGWALQNEFMKHLKKIWTEPDQGIWEVRGERQHFTYSKAMAWVAFDRSIKSAEIFKLEAPLAEWKKYCGMLHEDVCRRGFNPEINSFTRAYGSKELDASLLLLPAVGFLPPTDPRIRGTVEAIERNLMVDGLVLRYDTRATDDGLPAGEGVFLACSFWLVDAYLMLGRRDDAVRLFEHLLMLRNDVGLLSEQYDTRNNRLVGNFPQAFSHLALLNSASNLSAPVKPAEQRSEHSVQGAKMPQDAA
ncbi:MAG: glycoside hydrolase family 15 protein [Pseudolabrys sp.]